MNRLADQLPHRDAVKLLEAGPARLARLQTRRKLWLQAHLWLGLVLGLFLSVIGLTGSVLVFYDAIDKALNADLMTVRALPAGEAAFRPLADCLAAANAAMPGQAKLEAILYPADAGSAYAFDYQAPTAVGMADGWQVLVDPYHAQVLGKRLNHKAGDWLPPGFVAFVFFLHDALLVGGVGGTLVGVMAVLLLFSVLTGLIVWWPLTGKWRRALVIKRRASAERLNHDLHQTFGFYAAPVLLAVLLSGIYMNLPGQFMALVKLFSPATRSFEDLPHSMPLPGAKPLSLEQALDIARSRYPEGRLNWLRPALVPKATHQISFRDVPGLSRFWSERQIFIDPYSGAILAVRGPATRQTLGEGFMDWQWPLHSGKAFGWPGRILVFLTGLACPGLFVTGLKFESKTSIVPARKLAA